MKNSEKNCKKILLVDDDPTYLAIVQRDLNNAGYELVTTRNGDQAWQLLSAHPAQFSVVVCDRILPRLHGIDLLRKIQQHPQLKSLPFIMLTGIADKEEQIEALNAGAFDFLYKPVEKDLLLAVVKRALMSI